MDRIETLVIRWRVQREWRVAVNRSDPMGTGRAINDWAQVMGATEGFIVPESISLQFETESNRHG